MVSAGVSGHFLILGTREEIISAEKTRYSGVRDIADRFIAGSACTVALTTCISTSTFNVETEILTAWAIGSQQIVDTTVQCLLLTVVILISSFTYSFIFKFNTPINMFNV